MLLWADLFKLFILTKNTFYLTLNMHDIAYNISVELILLMAAE